MSKSHSHAGPLYSVLLDWWLAVVAFLVIAVLLVTIPTIATSKLSWWAMLLGILASLAAILYIVDTLFFTAYQLTRDSLVVTSQLRRYRFPYKDLGPVRQGSFWSLISFGRHKRFALSHTCYVIELRSEGWHSLSVSPRLRDEFLTRLTDSIERSR